jgi:aspartate aminotransferase-like enzyme
VIGSHCVATRGISEQHKSRFLESQGNDTTASEACQISLIKPGSKVITVAGGKFGERWQDIYDAYAASLSI